MPPRHSWAMGQAAQDAPFRPQATEERRASQRSLVSQQPLQVAGEQSGSVGQPLRMRAAASADHASERHVMGVS